ncbi:hypothetical protein [Microbacterium sp. XT11]|uniref:hypothetical protein n=1 Tax=Microbacterium sp. XT11 TaxID=367477 RepID=UPI000742F949|nr:hypothetical protein [Microbacterium sp. XT11]ALX65929.1 hypothetical protein AB663_000740 [Microbacterium sp. XT11]
MTSSRVASDLAAVLVPIGVVGAVLAALCAIVAAVAIVRGAGGLCGGAVGVWIPCALVSSFAGFANQWIPLIVAGAALAGSLTIGAVVRSLASASGYERPELARAHAVTVTAGAPETSADRAVAAASAAVTTRTASVPVATGTPAALARTNPARVA